MAHRQRAAPWMPSAARAPNRSPWSMSRWPNPPRRTTPTPTPTTARRHRGACDTTEWQQAYTTAWTWANETGDQNIIAGIKQIAGERKKQLSAGNGAQQ